MTDDIEREDDDELPPGPFVKIYGSIVYSSIWLEGAATRLLWITMLAIADQNGDVRASVRGLASTAKITDAECEAGLHVLESPDLDSRDARYQGRRIRRMRGGWHILNFRRYREMRTNEQIKATERQRRHRSRVREQDVTPLPSVTDVTNVTVTPEGEVEKEPVVAVGGVGESVTLRVADISTDLPTAWLSNGTLELTRMLNRGMRDNPQIGEAYNPVLATSGTTLEACEALKAAGVALNFAESWVYTLASAYKPRKLGDQINSLGYLVPKIVDAWQRQGAKIDASTASLPQESKSPSLPPSGNPPPKPSQNGTRDLKGVAMLIFGKLREGVREIVVLNNPDDPGAGNRLERRIRPDVMLELDAPAIAALAAIGGERAIVSVASDKVDGLSWRFAAAYQAAANG